MSDAPKKRPWFQIYLSTAIMLMFVADGLVFLSSINHTVDAASYGFPWTFYMRWPDPPYGPNGPQFSEFYYSNLAWDLAVLICVLALTGGVFEFMLRRRKP